MIRALLDTNVVLDYLLARAPFAYPAEQVWSAAKNGEFEPFVSAITPINIYYIARKLKGSADARRAVQGLRAVCQIATADRVALLDALILPLKDYEDAVQVVSAQAMSLDAIVTRNTGDYANAGLAILTPEQFLEQLAASSEQADS
ncbi:MAG TPA: PIN domain-containing protein [Anaerolineae bacterium]|nr:PIN domain-containing protein [Anaerolineae bacterium]